MTGLLPAALRGVLFDMDDTLFDHAFATRAALASLRDAEPALSVWTPDELVQRHSVVLEEMHHEVLAGRLTIDDARAQRFQRLLESASAGASAASSRAPALARQYREEYERAWRPVPGAMALVEALRSAGLAIGIVTNNLRAEQEFKLRRCDLDRHVDALIASSEVGITKPDPGIFDIALAQIGAARDEAVMVGDVWDTDIAGAHAAGIRAVWFNWRRLPPRDAAVPELISLLPTDDAVGIIAGRTEP